MTTDELKKERDTYYRLAEKMAEALELLLRERRHHAWIKGRVALSEWRGQYVNEFKNPRFSTQEDEFILKNSHLKIKEIAAHLGRSYSSVFKRLSRLGLKSLNKSKKPIN